MGIPRYQLYIDDLPIWAFVGEHSKFAVDVSHELNDLHTRYAASQSSVRSATLHATPFVSIQVDFP